ncbi:MAG TPA: hypothetical protein DEQ40_09085 [Oxalobacteraceae bacterium]|nr:hypothetical protein [Oxalobacteraceae bacterium]
MFEPHDYMRDANQAVQAAFAYGSMGASTRILQAYQNAPEGPARAAFVAVLASSVEIDRLRRGQA